MSEVRWYRRRWLFIVAAILLALLIAAPHFRRESIQYLTAKVQQGEIRDAVESSGTVSAVINVQVGSQVSGTISKLNADFNSRVHKGEVIAEIDPRLLQGALLQAVADVQNAQSNIVAAKANLARARTALVQTLADYDRAKAMTAKGIGTQQALDQAKANYESARAAVDAAIASVAQAEAQLSQKQAAVSVARINLNYAIIRSPIDGTVVARNVDVGQTVAASLQAPTIFTIAQDLSKMQVYAKVDESDVGRIRNGQEVTFKVDAFPKQVFQGKVSQIRMNPTTVQNVVTYDAIINFDNPELKLFPGMTAYVTIPVASVDDVVKVPNAALPFKPPLAPDALLGLYVKYGIDPGTREKAADAAGKRRASGENAVVWKLRADGNIEPVEITLGITDHAFTEVTGQSSRLLKPGDDVITTAVTSKSNSPGVQGIRR